MNLYVVNIVFLICCQCKKYLCRWELTSISWQQWATLSNLGSLVKKRFRLSTTVITKVSISVIKNVRTQSRNSRCSVKCSRGLCQGKSVIKKERWSMWSKLEWRTSILSAPLSAHFRCPFFASCLNCSIILYTNSFYVISLVQLRHSGYDRLLVWKVSHTARRWGDLRDLWNCRLGGKIQGGLLLYAIHTL